MTDTLTELERLHEAATPVPWVDAPCHWGKSGVFRELPPEPEPRSSLNGKPVSRVAPDELTWQDAALIAAMRNALPDLLKQARLAATLTSILCADEGQDVVGRAKALVEQDGRLKRSANSAGTLGDRLDEELQQADDAARAAGFDAEVTSPAHVIDSLRAALAEKDAELARMKERVAELERLRIPCDVCEREWCGGCTTVKGSPKRGTSMSVAEFAKMERP